MTTTTPEYFWHLIYAKDEYTFFESHTFNPSTNQVTCLDSCYTCGTQW
jgi:hypothetical protein